MAVKKFLILTGDLKYAYTSFCLLQADSGKRHFLLETKDWCTFVTYKVTYVHATY
jgi:hypothetical protein